MTVWKGIKYRDAADKLAELETNADVTDVTNVVEAGALMVADLENPPTEDEANKSPTSEWAFDHNARNATSGVQGHATAAQITKLDGIDTGAKDDQTGAEIKTAYEGEANTNAFTDGEQTKLGATEASATADQTGAEIKTAYEGEAETNAFTDAEKTKLGTVDSNADVTGSNTCDTPGGAGTDTTAIHYGTAVELGYTLDSEMSGDHKYSGITVSGTAGYGTTAIGQLVYLASDKKWELADADAEATTKPQLGIALAAVAENAALLVLLLGYVRDDGFSLTNDGAPVFVGLTAGAMVEDVSGYTTGDCVRIVGHIHDASANTIFFNPDGMWMEVA